MKTKHLFLILLALCVVFFLAGCDGGGGSSSGDEEDDTPWEVYATSVTVSGAADTDYHFEASGTGNTGTYIIRSEGLGETCYNGSIKITTRDGDNNPTAAKYTEKNYWMLPAGPMTPVPNPTEKNVNFTSSTTFEVTSENGYLIVFEVAVP